MLPVASQRNGKGRSEPVMALAGDGELHAVDAVSVMVVMFATIRWTLVIAHGRIAVVATVMGVPVPGIVIVAMFQR